MYLLVPYRIRILLPSGEGGRRPDEGGETPSPAAFAAPSPEGRGTGSSGFPFLLHSYFHHRRHSRPQLVFNILALIKHKFHRDALNPVSYTHLTLPTSDL